MDLKKHLADEHKISPLLTYLREIVFGGIDGIITTFAVVAGFAGAQASSSPLPILSVLLFGFANLFADATSMGLGNFLSSRADQEAYESEREKERREIRHSRKFEFEETIGILKMKGFSPQDAQKIAHLYAKNENYWIEFMMNQELGMPNPSFDNPYLTSLTTFFSFVFFGFIPILPFLIFPTTPQTTFLYSIIATIFAMFLLALLRWKVTKLNMVRSVTETLLIGSISALVAYFVGTFFRV